MCQNIGVGQFVTKIFTTILTFFNVKPYLLYRL